MKDESPRIAGITRRFWAHEFYVSRSKFAECSDTVAL